MAIYSPWGMSSQRKYYLFAAAVFGIGALLAIVGGDYTALFIFVVLGLTMLGIQARVDVWMENRRPTDRSGSGE